MDSKFLGQQVLNTLPINLISEMKLYSRGAVMAKIQATIDSAADANKRLATDSLVSYAILSHRWLNDGEPTYEEIVQYSRDRTRGREGFRKLLMFCQKAQEAGYCWAWSDTCCIDKRSSVELDESIRSMFRWYCESQLCIIHLSATAAREELAADPWFTRGWTLQELLAPSVIRFYNKSWELLTTTKDLVKTVDNQGQRGEDREVATLVGNCGGIPSDLTCENVLDLNDHTIKDTVPLLDIASAYGSFHNDQYDVELLKEIAVRTQIPIDTLSDFTPGTTKIREKMVWASSRETTRVEDIAYCLIGILDVSLTVAYGEGPRAFHRLQMAIMVEFSDPSFDLLFTWRGEASPYNRLFASKPNCFTAVDVWDEYGAMLEYYGLPLDSEAEESVMARGDPATSFSNSALHIALSIYKVRMTLDRRLDSATLEELEEATVQFHRLKLKVKELGEIFVSAKDDPEVSEDQCITDWRADLAVGVVDYDKELPWNDWKQWVQLDKNVEVWDYWPEKKERKMLASLRERRRYMAILLWRLGGGHFAKVETQEMLYITRPKKGWNTPEKVYVPSRYDWRRK